MATIDWPTEAAFVPRAMRMGAHVPRSAWSGVFSGQTQTLSHASDRLRCTVTLPPCDAVAGAKREAWVLGLLSTGDWVRMAHLHRSEPAGTLRGAPTIATTAAAGARSVQITTTPAATLVGGDVLGTGGQLLLTAYAGAVANGSGLITVPLVLPLPLPVTAGAAVTWASPTGTWQLVGVDPAVDYGRGRWQGALDISLLQVVPL